MNEAPRAERSPAPRIEAESPTVRPRINVISGGFKPRRDENPSVNLTTPNSKRVRGLGELHFSEEDGRDVTFPHDESLVVALHIGVFDVEKILVDGGSSADILYYAGFKKMGLGERVLKHFRQPLVGLRPRREGYVTLQVTVGDESPPKTLTRAIDFLVVYAPAGYNGLLGRPSMVAFKLTIKPRFMLIRFPTRGGEGEIRGDQGEARRCYQATLRRHHLARHRAKPSS